MLSGVILLFFMSSRTGQQKSESAFRHMVWTKGTLSKHLRGPRFEDRNSIEGKSLWQSRWGGVQEKGIKKHLSDWIVEGISVQK